MKLIIDVNETYFKQLKTELKNSPEYPNLDYCQIIIASGIPYEERPHGEWIVKVERRGFYAGDKTVYSYTCPFCGKKEFDAYEFCRCGADMRGKEE